MCSSDLYWRIRKVPNAVGMAGRINARRVSAKFMPRISMNTGTMVTCIGTIIVARIRANSKFLDRNSKRANTYPAIAEDSICPTAMMPVTQGA